MEGYCDAFHTIKKTKVGVDKSIKVGGVRVSSQNLMNN